MSDIRRVSNEEMLAAWEAGKRHARAIANGRLHDDDCDSEAGLAVARGLRRFDAGKPGSTFTTYAKRLVAQQMFRLLEREARYVHKGELFWGALVDTRSHSSGNVATENPTPKQLAEAGASARQIHSATGLTLRKSRILAAQHKGARNARSQAG